MDSLLRVFLALSCLMLAVQGLTVGTLNTTVTRSSCGTTRACFSDPADCDPATNSSCLFVSTRSTGSGLLDFELRGESSGYIAVALSTDETAGGNDKTYICANSNGTAKFFFALLNNTTLEIQNTTSISNVSASVNSTIIQCVFAVTGLNASMSRSADNTFAVVLAEGTLNSDGSLSTPTLRMPTALLDLSNPNSTNTVTVTTAPNVTTNANATTASTATTATTTTTAAATTASGANIGLQHSLSQALLILFGVLAISLL